MENKLASKYEKIFPMLSESQRRLVAAADAEYLGRGGIVAVSKASGMSRSTITIGIKELQSGNLLEVGRNRRSGGGRKRLLNIDSTLESDIDRMVSPITRGDPESPLLWCSKSLRNIAEALESKGHKISHNAIGMILAEKGYSLQSNRKTDEGGNHPDRDQQFEFINNQVKDSISKGQPTISIDCKKKELIGNFKNGGKELEPQKTPTKVNVYDFIDTALGKAIPYGIYDIDKNEGWVNIGISSDTAKFAVSSIRTWWDNMGKVCYPDAQELLITADGGGSNSSRSRLWKIEIQKFVNETNISVRVCHFPPGTSKWNKIEHKLFSFISMNWRGRPLTSIQLIISLIGATKSKSGLKVKTSFDENIYEKGIKISDEELRTINIKKNIFHGEWNYVIAPSVE
jgi:hypothetical protein